MVDDMNGLKARHGLSRLLPLVIAVAAGSVIRALRSYQIRSDRATLDPHEARAALLALLELAYPLVALGLVVLTGVAVVGLVCRRRSPGRIRSALARGVLVGAT